MNQSRHGIKTLIYITSAEGIGALQLLIVATGMLPRLRYAEKQFYVNRDLNYSFLSILRTVESLARIEVILNDEGCRRERSFSLRLNIILTSSALPTQI